MPQVLDDYKCYDEDMLYNLNEMNKKITELFDNYIYFIESYVTIYETFMPFVNDYLHQKNSFLSDNDIAKIFKVFQQNILRIFRVLNVK